MSVTLHVSHYVNGDHVSGVYSGTRDRKTGSWNHMHMVEYDPELKCQVTYRHTGSSMFKEIIIEVPEGYRKNIIKKYPRTEEVYYLY